VRLLWPIAARSTVAFHLPAKGRFVAIHYLGKIAFVMSGFAEDGNLLPFVLGEVCVIHSGQL
jgi:hypothetical protein